MHTLQNEISSVMWKRYEFQYAHQPCMSALLKSALCYHRYQRSHGKADYTNDSKLNNDFLLWLFRYFRCSIICQPCFLCMNEIYFSTINKICNLVGKFDVPNNHYKYKNIFVRKLIISSWCRDCIFMWIQVLLNKPPFGSERCTKLCRHCN